MAISTRLHGRNSTFPVFMFSNENSIVQQPTILIFDSGVGGLSIYSEVRQILPNAHYLYVFDNGAFPYGEKPEQFIINRIIAIIKTMWRLYNLDIIIIACNTASTISLPALRERFPCHIIGVVPAIKPAARLTNNAIIGLLATHATVQRKYTYDLISQFASNCQVLRLGTAELVNIAEAKLHGKTVQLSVLRTLLSPWLEVEEPPNTVVLGCTHFSLLSQELQLIFPKGTLLIDSCAAIARRVAWLVENCFAINNLHSKTIRPNRAYCLSATTQARALMPILIGYGFRSLETLMID